MTRLFRRRREQPWSLTPDELALYETPGARLYRRQLAITSPLLSQRLETAIREAKETP